MRARRSPRWPRPGDWRDWRRRRENRGRTGGPARFHAARRTSLDAAHRERRGHGPAQRAARERGFGDLVRDAEGNFYGTTNRGGAHGHGTVFKLDTVGNETVL